MNGLKDAVGIILLYCCEIWGLESALKCKESDPDELLHTKFMKEILGSAL
jgi:hypothetical protein